ncbi:MAG: prepilin-type N-terminal cleavage/methylation domain-containing protein [Verrucomicrobiales bacterium]|nr:prepilin-type N-terminal cleavage/methylation domain-containing protein [Verrucomicrobiales bacterium]
MNHQLLNRSVVRGGRSPAARRGRTVGFTLIELLISAALMAMVLTATYACFSAAIAGRRTIEARSDVLQSGRVALALISADLRSACPLSSRFAFLGMNRRLGEVEADNLDFATRNLSITRHDPPADWCEVSYFLEPDGEADDWVLYRRRDWTPDDKPLAGGAREEIVRGLQGLRFEYYDGWDWYDEWGDPDRRRQGENSWLEPANLEGMPDAVRITLWFDAGESPAATPEASTEKPPPPFVLQTVAYLNLAHLPESRPSGSSTNAPPQPPAAGPSGAPVPGGPS